MKKQRSKGKNQNYGIPARRDDFLYFAICYLHFDLFSSRLWNFGFRISKSAVIDRHRSIGGKTGQGKRRNAFGPNNT